MKHHLIRALLIIGFAAGFHMSATAPSSAYYLKKFPECHEHSVLKRITKLFNKADRMTWHRGIEMDHVSRPHGHGRYGFADSLIDRRYCHAYAHLSNGSRHKVYYVIEAGMGFAGTGYNVDFCLIQYDPWRVYDGFCRTVRPKY